MEWRCACPVCGEDRTEPLTRGDSRGQNGPVLTPLESVEEVRDCVAAVAGRCLVEVSGGITLSTIGQYAATGVDLVSVGAITNSAPVLDIGLDIKSGAT